MPEQKNHILLKLMRHIGGGEKIFAPQRQIYAKLYSK